MFNGHRIKLTVLSVIALSVTAMMSSCTTTAEPTEDPALYERMDTYGEIDEDNDSYPWLSSQDTFTDVRSEPASKPATKKKRVVRK